MLEDSVQIRAQGPTAAGTEPAFEAPASIAPDGESAPAAAETPAVDPRLLRAVWVLIFLLMVMSVYTIWPQAGGQSHLDLMPWYWKLFPPLAFCYAATKAARWRAERGEGFRKWTAAWAAMGVAMALVMAGVTYYYHLQETTEPAETNEGVMTRLTTPGGPRS